MEECITFHGKLRESDQLFADLMMALGMSLDGQVSLDCYDDCKAAERDAGHLLPDRAEDDYERRMAEEHWPFDDHDEDE